MTNQYYKKLGEIMYNIEVTEEEKPKGYSRQAIDNLLKIYVRNN